MNAKRALFQVFFYSVFALMVSACVSLPPQIKPAGPEAFAGEWTGSWHDYGGGTGDVYLMIGKPRESGGKTVIDLSVRLTNSRFASWKTVSEFAHGELVVGQQSLWMVLQLYGVDHIEAEYHNRSSGAKGTWSLTRKK